jgi:hypothetical protein
VPALAIGRRSSPNERDATSIGIALGTATGNGANRNVIGDPILIDPAEVRERCDCHVCETLRTVLAANLDVVHDRRTVTPLLLTISAAAELLGVSAGTVSGLITDVIALPNRGQTNRSRGVSVSRSNPGPARPPGGSDIGSAWVTSVASFPNLRLRPTA